MVDELILGKFSMLYRVVETLKRTCIIDVIASALAVHQHIAGCIDSVCTLSGILLLKWTRLMFQ